MNSVPNSDGPVEKGWLEYQASISVADLSYADVVMSRLAFFAGAAHALMVAAGLARAVERGEIEPRLARCALTVYFEDVVADSERVVEEVCHAPRT